MENTEKYYRRSYNAINKLIDVYKFGYSENKTKEFQNHLRKSMLSNPKLMKEERTSLMFTIVVALLGLNKESMERTNKFSDYKKSHNALNIRNMGVSSESRIKLNEFDKDRVISTEFDDWLSITTKIDSDTTNLDHLRRVRNGLLHSNFYLDQEYTDISFAHIKTKSYYESEILNEEFQMFVFEYFSNLGELGLTEKINFFNIPIVKINTREELIRVLHSLSIINYDYDNLTSLENDTPELLLKESTNKYGVVDITKFNKKLNNTNNYQNMNVTSTKLEHIDIAHIFIYIEKNFGNNFYELDKNTQSSIITSYIQYRINPKREVSNWLLHFWYLYSTLYNGKFHKEFFSGDEFANESCYSSLLILKAYLIMYRLQHKDFDEIDYSKILFDIYDFDVVLNWSNIKNPNDKQNYFKESYDKEKAKGILTDDKDIWNKIVCEILRNSLAHGNIKAYVDTKTLESMIELTDIDQKKGGVRTIKMPLSKFEQLLKSDSFLPKYCIKKNEDLKRTLTP